MPCFKLAHIHEQGQDMLLFPLDNSFEFSSSDQQNATVEELELRANQAGLAGHAVAFWERGGRTRFLGPVPWRGFLQSMDLRSVLANVNREISW